MSNYLTINRTYADADVLYQADLDNICSSISNFLNTTKLNADNIAPTITERFVTPGTVMFFGSSTPPTGWLGCDGTEVSQITYATLYSVIGSTFNTGGEGAGNFRLPSAQNTLPVGRGGSGTATLGNALGNSGGDDTVTLNSTTFLPSHAHTSSTGHAHAGVARTSGGSATDDFLSFDNDTGTLHTTTNSGFATPTFSNAGSNGAHANQQPSVVLLFMIKT